MCVAANHARQRSNLSVQCIVDVGQQPLELIARVLVRLISQSFPQMLLFLEKNCAQPSVGPRAQRIWAEIILTGGIVIHVSELTDQL